jgi:molybdopterin-containing oxidoreductase family molybdopterin binding subunit
MPSLLREKPDPTLEISPADAQPRDIMDGDAVRVFNNRGQVKLRARLSHRIKPGVVDIAQGWLTDQYLQGHPNELTHESVNTVQQSILGPNAALYDVLVQVEKAQE